MSAQTRYARNGGVHLAYQVRGAGAHDIVAVMAAVGSTRATIIGMGHGG